MLLDQFELVYTFHPSLGSLIHDHSISIDQQVNKVFLEDESTVFLQMRNYKTMKLDLIA